MRYAHTYALNYYMYVYVHIRKICMSNKIWTCVLPSNVSVCNMKLVKPNIYTIMRLFIVSLSFEKESSEEKPVYIYVHCKYTLKYHLNFIKFQSLRLWKCLNFEVPNNRLHSTWTYKVSTISVGQTTSDKLD